MEMVSGGNQCSNYDNALATTGMIVGALGLALATGGLGMIALASIGFGASYLSVLSCNGTKLF
ncbi:hypothetical protein MM239_13705 [Belliella sp. DSM 111904]|uniref:Uncharacterized protein n=1 Tax=Belliella filtrata TaxID=2923435 RepID=A0ABS9V202_9BACT|nr:hypothetical protein [Belliella filtrata]MCH7410457.1 hypothetical protein [Belliella filtrata]